MKFYWLQHIRTSQQAIPRATLLSNAIIGYVIYLRQTFWPVGLAVFYPYSRVVGASAIFGALAVVVIVTRRLRSRTRPWLTVGWFWYLGMLVPVIGFVQSGDQSHADHHTYLPLVGIFIMLAWGGLDVSRRWAKAAPWILRQEDCPLFWL